MDEGHERRPVLSAALAALAACSRLPPVAATADPELCVDRASIPRLVAPHGDQVGVCFGRPPTPLFRFDADCYVIDHARGRMLSRTGLDPAEMGLPPELEVTAPPSTFEIESTETETRVCRDGSCQALRLPGVADQQTVSPALSADGSQLSYVYRDSGRAYLDTLAVDPRARRIGRVLLAIGTDASEHGFRVVRVGTAMFVVDIVGGDHGEAWSSSVLVDPLTSAQRVLRDGMAIELDAGTALVVNGKRASVVQTQALIERGHVEGSDPLIEANDGIGVIAFSNPPRIVIVERRRITRSWRLPTCAGRQR